MFRQFAQGVFKLTAFSLAAPFLFCERALPPG
jgi:hypothetical protein